MGPRGSLLTRPDPRALTPLSVMAMRVPSPTIVLGQPPEPSPLWRTRRFVLPGAPRR